MAEELQIIYAATETRLQQLRPDEKQRLMIALTRELSQDIVKEIRKQYHTPGEQLQTMTDVFAGMNISAPALERTGSFKQAYIGEPAPQETILRLLG